MCGIAGILASGAIEPALADGMADALVHRGPDDRGVWIDGDAGIALSHRRLSIVDLSPHGHQPMVSADGRWMLSYNGEIYNHPEMRAALERDGAAPPEGWRGHSDTETLLQAIAVWGLPRALEFAAGMFALALWDRAERQLHLARDRFGEKPLFYGWVGKDFVFASELKAIRLHPAFTGEIDRASLGAYFARSYVPAPRAIFRGLYKLPAGCILSLDRTVADRAPAAPPTPDMPQDGSLRIERYWSYRQVFAAGRVDPFGSEGEALAALEQALAQAIRGQAVADVPVGAFLSGGIDSSAVVALYRKYTTGRIATYTIGFEEAGFDEAPYAAAVAKHFGTDHHTHYVSVAEARGVIPSLGTIYDEPFADASQIPTILVSRFARRDVTVALSGDGGDELFAGYNRHVVAPALWRKLSRVPLPLRRAIGAPLSRLPSSLLQRGGNLLPGSRQPHFGAKMQKALQLAGSAHVYDDVYAGFLDEWAQDGLPLAGGATPPSLGSDAASEWSPTERTMYWDAMTYLTDDVMVKVDRAAMSCSLETRAPLLDHRVAAVAARVPLSMKIRDGQGKLLLRRMLYQNAPESLFGRPKAGFSVPVGQWIKGPLRDWAEALLDPTLLARQGYLDAGKIRRRWDQHLSGWRDGTPALWGVLMFQAWLAAQ